MTKGRGHWIQAFLALFGVATIFAYIAVSGVTNAQPPTQAYPGWVAVLQPDEDAIPQQVELMVEALEPGAPGDHPVLRYSVLVCGSRSFHGVLLIGGQARLDHAQVVDEYGVSSADTTAAGALRVDDLPDVTIGQSTASWDLGAAQLIHIAIDQPTSCVPSASPEQPIQAGTVEMVTGLARAPVQRTATFHGLASPRSSQVWPLVGGFPSVPTGDLGEFRGVRGLSGSWMVPPSLHEKVSRGSLAARVSVDLALPPPTDTTSLTWNSVRPLRPAVRLTDVDAMAAWQGYLVAAGICLGIGGSLLATLLFEWTRPRPPEEKVTVGATTLTVTPPLIGPNSVTRPMQPLLTASIVLIAYALGRSRR